jgi:hypothetical protein
MTKEELEKQERLIDSMRNLGYEDDFLFSVSLGDWVTWIQEIRRLREAFLEMTGIAWETYLENLVT